MRRILGRGRNDGSLMEANRKGNVYGKVFGKIKQNLRRNKPETNVEPNLIAARRSAIVDRSLGPEIPIQRTVIDGFADMSCINVLVAREIGDGPRNL